MINSSRALTAPERVRSEEKNVHHSIESLFQKLNNGGCDWRIKSFDGWKLEFAAGSSVEYSRPIVQFFGVTYLGCAVEFSHPTFRLASNEERAGIATLVVLDEEDIVIIIEAETMARLEPNRFSIVVESWTFSNAG